MSTLETFRYDDLSDNLRASVHDDLASTTLKHIMANPDLFEPLPYDPEKHRSQQLETVELSPTLATYDEIEAIATGAAPELFLAARTALREQTDIRDAVLEKLRQGEHVSAVTTHGTLADVAIWSAALAEYLEEEDSEAWKDHNGLVISRGITTIGIVGMGIAGSELLQKGNRVFMSLQRTNTIAQLGLPDSLVSTNNARMRQRVHRWIDQPAASRTLTGRNLNMAWSGKTDAIEYGDDHQPEHVTLGSVNQRTVDIVRRGWVLPAVLWADAERQKAVLGAPTKVETKLGAQRVQRWQADTLATILEISADAVDVES
ncbi:MAG TPA: hypothetical protein VK694_02520 [Verrucomicrobiae bacterium]|nr:hypothetical protein [Verrucomicrobiae bacterium]